jgi:transketolase
MNKVFSPQNTTQNLVQICSQLRRYILESTTNAGSGHPTSSLSSVEIMASLMFGGFFDENCDKLIFSKGHACPLLYSIYTTNGQLSYLELMTLRQFGSRLEGHPTMKLPFVEAATGSLGQGLGVATGICIAQKMLNTGKTFVLLGDSEMAEGSNWEALMLASHQNLDNLVAIVDVNRLGQRGETMFGSNAQNYADKLTAFGCETIIIDGQDLVECSNALKVLTNSTSGKPKAIVCKTQKGAGISFLADKENWHGKVLNKEQLELALAELN